MLYSNSTEDNMYHQKSDLGASGRVLVCNLCNPICFRTGIKGYGCANQLACHCALPHLKKILILISSY